MTDENQTDAYRTFEILTRFREPLITDMIHSLPVKAGSIGLDIGCGIGYITKILGEKAGPDGRITGLDYSSDFIKLAGRNTPQTNIRYQQGDVNRLAFAPDSFDWIWSMDTIWAGPKQFGCPTENPDPILKKLHQIVKPGGSVFLSFWTSQKLLPGYPLLEARLNGTTPANAPYLETMKPEEHVLNAKGWLSRANFKNITAKTFLHNIDAPLSDNSRAALSIFFRMLWGKAESEVSPEDWEAFNRICSPDSDAFILNSPDYYGFYTYTLFKGQKPDG